METIPTLWETVLKYRDQKQIRPGDRWSFVSDVNEDNVETYSKRHTSYSSVLLSPDQSYV
jgi:hypothetical protein